MFAHAYSFAPSRRHALRRDGAVAIAAIIGATLVGCAPAEPTVEDFCTTLAEHRDAYLTSWSAAQEQSDLAGLLTGISAVGDLKLMWQDLAENSPAAIRSDAEAVRDAWGQQEGASASGDFLEAIGTALVNSGSMSRVDEYARENCSDVPEAPAAADTPEPVDADAADPTTFSLSGPVLPAHRSEAILLTIDEDMATSYDVEKGTSTALQVPREQSEIVDATTYAVEQDDSAEPQIAAVSYVSTESSGLTQKADYLRLTMFSPTGRVLSDMPLDPSFTGRDVVSGWTFVPMPANAAMLVNGTLVLTTMASDQWVIAGIDTASASTLWSQSGPGESDEDEVLLTGDGKVVLDWQGQMTLVDPATGALGWTAPEPEALWLAIGDLLYDSTYPPGSGMKVDELRVAATGEVRHTAFTTSAFDPVDGQFSLGYARESGSYVEGYPAFQSFDSDGVVQFELPTAQGEALGRLQVLAQYDGRVWIEANSGMDLIDAATGERDPLAQERGILGANATEMLPIARSTAWTIVRSYSTFSDWGEEYTLLLHPDGPPELADLPTAQSTSDGAREGE